MNYALKFLFFTRIPKRTKTCSGSYKRAIKNIRTGCCLSSTEDGQQDTILNEVSASQFDDSYRIEAYLANYEGFTGGDILSKFGVQSTDQINSYHL